MKPERYNIVNGGRKYASYYAFEFIPYHLVSIWAVTIASVFIVGEWYLAVLLYMVFIGGFLHSHLYGQWMTRNGRIDTPRIPYERPDKEFIDMRDGTTAVLYKDGHIELIKTETRT